ncbi:MAG TPA: hypothetical protein PLL10_02750, partial [Elusimicrobiales bacterium]|nr:hypothetical protein [Elusimicrobiales bacterium]
MKTNALVSKLLLLVLLLLPISAGANRFVNVKTPEDKLNLAQPNTLDLREDLKELKAQFPDMAQELDICAAAIAELDPDKTAHCDAVSSWLLRVDPSFAAFLASQSAALNEMKTILFSYGAYGSKKTYAFRQALLSTLEMSPYASMGFGPSPDSFLAWTYRFKKECPQCAEAAIGATLPWEALRMRTKMIAAQMLGRRSHNKEVPDLKAAKAKWDNMTLAQRVRLLGTYENNAIEKYIKGNCDNSAEEKSAVRPYLGFASDTVSAKYSDYEMRCDLLDKLREKGRVDTVALDKYGRLPLGRRMQELSDYLERSGQQDTLTYRQINEQRVPMDISRKDIKALSAMFAPELLAQFRTTEAGREVAAYYDRGEMKFNLDMEPQKTSYAYYDPDTGKVVLGSALLSNFLRTHGLEMKDMLASPEIRRQFAMFVVPAMLHECVHQVQHHWSVKNGIPDMYVKIKEDETFSFEGIYLEQRMRTDTEFRRMYNLTRLYSSFIQGENSVRRQFMASPEKLKTEVNDLYYPNIRTVEGGRSLELQKMLLELVDRSGKPWYKQAAKEIFGLSAPAAIKKDPHFPYAHMKTSVLEDMLELFITNDEILRRNEERVWADVLARRKALLDAAAAQ